MSKLFCGTLETPRVNDALDAQNEMGLKLFKIELSGYYGRVSQLENYLTSTELQRAKRYHFEKDRNRFIICRSILKILLAEQIGLEVYEISIDIHPNKKPYLSSHPSVFFNVSHAGEYALIAIGKNIVGVDVEKVDQDYDYSETIPHIFNKTEIDILSATTDLKRTFFKFWTRKEAIVKATGIGISDDFAQIPASDGLHVLESELLGNIPNLLVLSFDLDEHYIGSVAFEGKNKDVKTLHFSPLPSIKEIF